MLSPLRQERVRTFVTVKVLDTFIVTSLSNVLIYRGKSIVACNGSIQ